VVTSLVFDETARLWYLAGLGKIARASASALAAASGVAAVDPDIVIKRGAPARHGAGVRHCESRGSGDLCGLVSGPSLAGVR
jgi:hypothetical protein